MRSRHPELVSGSIPVPCGCRIILNSIQDRHDVVVVLNLLNWIQDQHDVIPVKLNSLATACCRGEEIWY